jgi:hypothetical protein
MATLLGQHVAQDRRTGNRRAVARAEQANEQGFPEALDHALHPEQRGCVPMRLDVPGELKLDRGELVERGSCATPVLACPQGESVGEHGMVALLPRLRRQRARQRGVRHALGLPRGNAAGHALALGKHRR